MTYNYEANANTAIAQRYSQRSRTLNGIIVAFLIGLGLFLLYAKIVGGIHTSSPMIIGISFAIGTILSLAGIILAILSARNVSKTATAKPYARWISWGLLITTIILFIGVFIPHDYGLYQLSAEIPTINQLQKYCGQPLSTLQTDMQSIQSSANGSSTGKGSRFKQTQSAILQVNAQLAQLAQQSTTIQALQTSSASLQPILDECKSIYQNIAQAGALNPKLMIQLMNSRTIMATDMQMVLSSINGILFPFILSSGTFNG